MIQFNSALNCGACSTSAQIQAYAAFIENLLVSAGWVVTADTGQTPPASLTITTAAAGLKVGYRIYRMADTLQSTSPIFMKIIFGTGAVNSTPYSFGFWVAIGTGTNGAGSITGTIIDYTTDAYPTVGIASANAGLTTACNSYGSADVNRVVFGMFIQATNYYPLFFSLERSKDVNGADTGDGLLWTFTPGYNNSLQGSGYGSTGACMCSRYLICNPTVGQPHLEYGLAFVLPCLNPSDTFGGDVGFGLVMHFKGIAQQPGTQAGVVKSNDVGVEGQFSATLYGVAHTYQHLNSLAAAISTATPSPPATPQTIVRSDTRMVMRYD